MRLATPFAFCLAACWYAVPGAGHDLMSNTPFRRDGYSSNNESHQVAPTTPEETSMLETARVAMASLEWPGEVMKQHKEDGLRAMHQSKKDNIHPLAVYDINPLTASFQIGIYRRLRVCLQFYIPPFSSLLTRSVRDSRHSLAWGALVEAFLPLST